MPLAAYDKFYGGKRGAASRALQEMVKHYGLAKGTQVFYSMLNDRKKKARGRDRA